MHCLKGSETLAVLTDLVTDLEIELFNAEEKTYVFSHNSTIQSLLYCHDVTFGVIYFYMSADE